MFCFKILINMKKEKQFLDILELVESKPSNLKTITCKDFYWFSFCIREQKDEEKIQKLYEQLEKKILKLWLIKYRLSRHTDVTLNALREAIDRYKEYTNQ